MLCVVIWTACGGGGSGGLYRTIGWRVRVWEVWVSAGLLFRVGRMKDSQVVKGHERWDWGR
jgi:hypothetical protein